MEKYKVNLSQRTESCSSLRTFSKELIWCSNHPNDHTHTFRKRWSIIWGCFFPVSILNLRAYLRSCFVYLFMFVNAYACVSCSPMCTKGLSTSTSVLFFRFIYVIRILMLTPKKLKPESAYMPIRPSSILRN